TTWTAQSSGTAQQLNGVAFTDSSHGWAVGQSGVIVTTSNGGATWTAQMSGSTLNLTGVGFVDSSHGWAVGQTGTVLGTATGGTLWTAQVSGTTQQLNGVVFTDASHGWAAGQSGVIVATSNGGTLWTAQTTGSSQNLLAISAASSTALTAVGAAGTILATSNAGGAWSAQSSGTTLNLRGNATAGGRGWAVGQSGVIVVFHPSPLVTAVSPASGPLNCSASITVTGSGFLGATAVSFGTVPAPSFTVVSDTQITTDAPAVLGAQTVDVTVVAPGGTSTTGAADQYSYAVGSLGLGTPASVVLPAATLGGIDQTVTASVTLSPDDETGAGSGWHLLGTSTTFVNAGGATLPTTATSVTAASTSVATGSTCPAASNQVSVPVQLPAGASAPTAVSLFDAAAGTGMGPSTVTLTVRLSIPALARAGSYSSQWTLTIASGP
ncbi:MAG TPA: YCF48-related protein, partial [Candidatus Dormibacteraeota bacterium]|nr:YCF48-related protein [Candidatus Dormibacteraeota bacterium]